MSIERESSVGSQNVSTESEIHPSVIIDPVVLQRLRWRCRRGLLELDIVLGRFVIHRYPLLDEAQKVIFDELLDLPDTVLWDYVSGGKAPAHEHQREVLEWLQQA